jgi:GxxExxY protein
MRCKTGYRDRIDLLVNNAAIVELKAVAGYFCVFHEARLLPRLRLRDCRLGLRMNFQVVHWKDGSKRMVNRFRDSSAGLRQNSAPCAVKGLS